MLNSLATVNLFVTNGRNFNWQSTFTMPSRPLVERNLRTVNGCDCWVVYVLDIQGVWGPLRFFSSWMVGEIQVSLRAVPTKTDIICMFIEDGATFPLL